MMFRLSQAKEAEDILSYSERRAVSSSDCKNITSVDI